MAPLVCTPQEASSMLRVRKERIYELIDQGELPAYREGRNWKIPFTAVEEYALNRAQMESERRKNESIQH